MNLTLKQMFKFGAVCMGVCALSASAVDYVSDSFEVLDGGAIDKPIGEYKQVAVGPQQTTTNWFAESGDASKLVEVNAAYAAVADRGPITNATKALMLKLETEGNTLSRAVTNELNAFVTPVYIDTLIQFTPSEDEPVISGTDVKVALYVNAESNLVVYSKKFTDLDEYELETANSVIDLGNPIDPEKWYRLSMEVSFVGSYGFTQIWVDGELVTHANATTADLQAYGGSFFANQAITQTDIAFISFQGTGALDELVVTDEMPTNMSPPASVMLTLAYSGPGTVLFATDGYPAPKGSGTPITEVESGVQVYMTSSDWYQMGTATGSDASFATSRPINDDQKIDWYTTFTADNSSTVTVETALLSGAFPMGGDVFMDLATVAAWGLAQGYGQADVQSDLESYMDAYLLNVSTNVAGAAELVITSIAVDKVAGTTTITVEAQNDEDAVDFTALNGEVTVYTTSDLSVAFDLVGTFSASIDDAGKSTVVIQSDTDQFLKAKVEILPTPAAQ